MNYQETIDWMFNQLPMYQSQGASAYKEDLTNTLLLTQHLNHPEKDLKCIHVAGTNGKGSTSHLLASVLQEAGYKALQMLKTSFLVADKVPKLSHMIMEVI